MNSSSGSHQQPENGNGSHQHHQRISSSTFDFQPNDFSIQFGIENIENLKPESLDFVNLYRETNYQQQPAFVPMNAASLLAREDFALNSPTMSHSSSGYFSPFGDGGDMHATTDFSAPHIKFDGMKLGDASSGVGVSATPLANSAPLHTGNSVGELNMSASNGDLTQSGSNNPNEYVCAECSRTFTKLVALRSHEVVHTNEKKHNCLYCSKAFARRHDMLRHERTVHATEKALTCELCKNTFPDLDSLQLHCVQENHPFPDRQNPAPVAKVVKTKGKIHKKSHSGHGLGPSQAANMKRMIPSNASFSAQGMPMQIPLGNISGVPHHNAANSLLQSNNISSNPSMFGLPHHQNQQQLFNGQQQGLKQQGMPIIQQQQQQQQPWNNQMMPSGMTVNQNQQPVFMQMNFAPQNSAPPQQQPSGFPTNPFHPQQQQQQQQFGSNIHQHQPANQPPTFLPEFTIHPSSATTAGGHQRLKDQSSLPPQLDIQKQMQDRAAAQLTMHTPLFNTNMQQHHHQQMHHGDTLISPAFRRSSAMFDDPFESAVDGLVIQEPAGGAEAFMPLSVLSMDFEP